MTSGEMTNDALAGACEMFPRGTLISLTPCFSKVIAQRRVIKTVLTVFQSSRRVNSPRITTKTVETVLGLRRVEITLLKQGVNEMPRALLVRRCASHGRLADGPCGVRCPAVRL